MRKQTAEQVLRNKVEFYCDECGKYLGTSTEYDDGYIPIPVEVKSLHERLYLDSQQIWYKFDGGELCYSCYVSKRDDLIDGLRKIGFASE